jgi:DUF2924 family protein
MRRYSKEPARVEAEIVHLRTLATDALRRYWRVIFGRTPPADFSRDLLRRTIAWRLQERAFGGLDRESLRFLDRLARQGSPPRRPFKPGTLLVRDYRGERHTVTVARDGFEWQGRTYRSLSAIARAITGTQWNGPRFFALRERKAGPARRTNKRVRMANGSPCAPGLSTEALVAKQTSSQCLH